MNSELEVDAQILTFDIPDEALERAATAQDECQASVAEEYVIPDVPANPGNVTLTMLFNAACDLGLSAADTVSPAHRAPREIIEEFLVSPDSLRMLVKFDK